MWKKSDDFSEADISRILASPQAQQLAAMLQQMDTDTLNKAASLAVQGDAAQAQQLLTPVLQDPKIQELIQKMGENNG